MIEYHSFIHLVPWAEVLCCVKCGQSFLLMEVMSMTKFGAITNTIAPMVFLLPPFEYFVRRHGEPRAFDYGMCSTKKKARKKQEGSTHSTYDEYIASRCQ